MKIRGLRLDKGDTYLVRIPDYAASDPEIGKRLSAMADKAECRFLVVPRSMTWRKIKRSLLKP